MRGISIILRCEDWSQSVTHIMLQVGCVTKRAVGGGLGISLEGTVDVEDGVEVRPHHYIRSILPQGPVGATGRFWNGDQLLEVNGIDLTGMFHQEVVSTLKTVGVAVVLVCSRRVSGPSPLHGTIVNNVETDCSKQAFNTRVSLPCTRVTSLTSRLCRKYCAAVFTLSFRAGSWGRRCR